MASVFDLLGWNTQAHTTLIPQLGISNPLYKLQAQSQKYFVVNENALASDGNVLAVSVQKDQGFNLNNEQHLAHLRACTALFNEKSQALKSIDRNIALGVVVGIVASSLSFLPFVGYFSFVGWGAALVSIHQRATAYTEYQEALNLLAATCNWSLGEGVDVRKSSSAGLINNPDIREMMTSLYPVLSEPQIKHLVADDIEEGFAAELRAYESKYKLSANTNTFFASTDDERIALSKRGAEINRCVYGLNKGKATDFLDAFVSSIPDIYHAAHHSFKRLQHWWSADTKPVADENAQGTTATL